MNQVVQKAYLSRIFLNAEGKVKAELAFFRRKRVKKWPIERRHTIFSFVFFRRRKNIRAERSCQREKKKVLRER